MKAELLQQLNLERAARRPAVLITELETGAQRLVTGDALQTDPLAEVLDKAMRSGKSAMIEQDGAQIFLNVQVPPVKLVVLGAVHISQALAPLAKLTGFDMVVIDPRTAFATPERFSGVKVMAEWPEVALPQLGGLDRYCAVVAVTHDPKIDDPGLIAALKAECFYIGALGSRKTHAKRVERLQALGFNEADIARIHAPIGLDIGAVSPEEIAVSILAEMISFLRKKPLRSERAA